MLSINNLLRSTSHNRSHLTNYVSLRWRNRPRKPFWLGLAKSKLFVIPKRKELPEDQKEELNRLTNIYERQMRTMENFMSTHVLNLEEERLESIQQYIDYATIVNENWNAQTALLRKERLKNEEEKRLESILNEISENKKKMEEINAKVNAIVQKEIEMSDTYITEENLDEAIEKCLRSVQDYNYAIDLSGNIYKGESKEPVDKMTAIGNSK